MERPSPTDVARQYTALELGAQLTFQPATGTMYITPHYCTVMEVCVVQLQADLTVTDQAHLVDGTFEQRCEILRAMRVALAREAVPDMATFEEWSAPWPRRNGSDDQLHAWLLELSTRCPLSGLPLLGTLGSLLYPLSSDKRHQVTCYFDQVRAVELRDRATALYFYELVLRFSEADTVVLATGAVHQLAREAVLMELAVDPRKDIVRYLAPRGVITFAVIYFAIIACSCPFNTDSDPSLSEILAAIQDPWRTFVQSTARFSTGTPNTFCLHSSGISQLRFLALPSV